MKSFIFKVLTSLALLTSSVESLTFDDWIDAVGLVKIEVIIRESSSITVARAIQIVGDRVDATAALPEFLPYDVKASIADFRTGNIYEVFSAQWMTKYNQVSKSSLLLDNVSIQELLNRDFGSNDGGTTVNLPDNILSGYSGSLQITGFPCSEVVTFANPDDLNYSITTSYQNREDSIHNITDRNSTSFKVSIIDTKSLIYKEQNCNAIGTQEVDYAVIFR
jgi:hypothetical protein